MEIIEKKFSMMEILFSCVLHGACACKLYTDDRQGIMEHPVLPDQGRGESGLLLQAPALFEPNWLLLRI